MAAATVPPRIRIENILSRMERYRPDLDEDLLRHAYVFAANRHQGQIRRSGEPYFTHPLTVAWILADMELDEETVAAGLLHDLLEDTDTTAEELEVEFGPEVARLVVALTKDGGLRELLLEPRSHRSGEFQTSSAGLNG